MPRKAKPYWGPPWMFRVGFVLFGVVLGASVGFLFGGEVGAFVGACISGLIALDKSS